MVLFDVQKIFFKKVLIMGTFEDPKLMTDKRNRVEFKLYNDALQNLRYAIGDFEYNDHYLQPREIDTCWKDCLH